MNIEHLLNYLLADSFGKVGMAIETLAKGERISDDMKKLLEGFTALLQGNPPPAQTEPSVMEQLAGFAEPSEVNSIQEAWDELRRGEGDEDAGESGDEDTTEESGQDGGTTERGPDGDSDTESEDGPSGTEDVTPHGSGGKDK